MLHGIDISNWQAGIKIPDYIDFCVVKVTEGTSFVDKYASGFIDQCKQKNILFGFYHFMTKANPEEQAVFFAKCSIDWNMKGIPVLDIERDNIPNWGEWAQRFVDKYHAITTVYPMIYCSASKVAEFEGYPLVNTCGLWVAGYPSNREYQFGETPEFSYKVKPWSFAAMWQFTANGRIDTFYGALDFDVAYMSRHAWMLYANPNSEMDKTQSMPTPVTNDTPDNDNNREWHFENNRIEVNVKLK